MGDDLRHVHINGLQHLGLPVIDLARSRAFYTRLGFVPVMEKSLPAERPTADDASADDPSNDAIQVLMLELNGFVLELYQLVGDERTAIGQRADGRIDHVALDVSDIDAVFAAAQAAGLEPLEDAPVFLPFWEKGIRYFNVRGPDGEKVEFCERLK